MKQSLPYAYISAFTYTMKQSTPTITISGMQGKLLVCKTEAITIGANHTSLDISSFAKPHCMHKDFIPVRT